MITVFNKCSAVAEMGDRLATIDKGPKLGAVPLLGERCPHVTQCGLGQGLPSYPTSYAYLDPSSLLATTDRGRKVGAVPLGDGAGSTSNTKLPALRPTIVLSGI